MIDQSTTSLVIAVLLAVLAVISLLNLVTLRSLRRERRRPVAEQFKYLSGNNRALADFQFSREFQDHVDESLVSEAMIALTINERSKALSDMPDEQLRAILARLGYRQDDDGYRFELLGTIREFFRGEKAKIVVEKVAEKLLGIFNKLVGVGG